jgi:hypothetical protein
MSLESDPNGYVYVEICIAGLCRELAYDIYFFRGVMFCYEHVYFQPYFKVGGLGWRSG